MWQLKTPTIYRSTPIDIGIKFQDVDIFNCHSNNIADSSNAGMYTSIATDSIDNVHISYMDKIGGHLKYATNAPGQWVTTDVDSVNGFTGEYSSIALDSKNKVHISYSDYSHCKYATNSSGNWVITAVESYATAESSYWGYTSIAIDSEDNIHISYFDDTSGNQNLKYAFYTAPVYDATGTWNYSESNNWASSGCLPDADKTGTFTIAQIGHSVTLDSDAETLDGSVSGSNYYFTISFYENGGKTTYNFNHTLSSNTSGSGKITWKQENGCEGGKDVIFTQNSIPSSWMSGRACGISSKPTLLIDQAGVQEEHLLGGWIVHKNYMTDNGHYVNRFSLGRKGCQILTGCCPKRSKP
jgi:hypothetical protein